MFCPLRLRAFAVAVSLAVAFLSGTSGAQAANDNNLTIPLTGAVASDCTVSDDSASATTSFSDMTQGASNVLVGTITETCNDKSGYKVMLTTTNNANFKGTNTGTLVPYNLAYNGTDVTFSNGSAVITDSSKKTKKQGVAKALDISFAAGYYIADTYNDTITITMASN